MSQKPIVVILDGIDGAGKSTLVTDVHAYLVVLGRKATWFRDPGGTDIGEKIRTLVKSASVPMHQSTQFLLFCAARAELSDVVNKHLASGSDIVLDRWWYSTYAYQGASGISREHILATEREFFGFNFPESLDDDEALEGGRVCAYHLHVAPRLSRERIAAVNRVTDTKLDRFESKPPEFLQRVYEGYLDLEQRGFMQRVETNDRTLRDVGADLLRRVQNQVDRFG